jgi:polyketide cyclase/dehydrase/lipid transport protein
MRMFDVQAIEINAPRDAVFAFVRDPANLPRWAHAFQAADETRARLVTPGGTVDIGLRTETMLSTGTVDWHLQFPDGSVGPAHSRVIETSRGTAIYSFVLHAPPVPIERLEGALDAQRATLQKELVTLKSLMER